MSAFRPPNLGAWKRGAVFLLSPPAPDLALPLLSAHELNAEATTPNNAHPKPFARGQLGARTIEPIRLEY